jgi:hypothetical protein
MALRPGENVAICVSVANFAWRMTGDDRWKRFQRNSKFAFKGSHFERDLILWGVRERVAYPISFPQLGELMEERGVWANSAPRLGELPRECEILVICRSGQHA